MDGETPNSTVEAIFSSAMELSGPQRAEYLARACGDDAVLRRQVEALLQIHEAPEGFLPEQPGADAGPRAGSVAAGAGAGPTEHLGDLIGRYKLLEKLGEGGFGVVYVAEQKEPVKRQVALKVIKLGMDTRQVVGRFEIERQALALMDHPNIAKVLDAGATDAGRPYFVMELVRGVPLTNYCDQHKLAPAQRLALFTQVCRAIQHAHQKGIIHRDIKPSNILVTIQDGAAVPKVIDFGIAKATAGELTDKTVFTQFQQFIGTPAYMSPEQTEPSGLNIDTRSDIYALGVLLYELLVGKTPFDTKELLRAGLDQMRRTIREKEPLRPSTRLGGLAGDELTTTARRRGTEPRRLISLLRGDLDWVAMKCLEKDRTRRYETANGLAMDIERYLAQEPVVARPPSGVYRLQKLVRRNKLVFAAAGAVTVALVLGVVISTWQAVRARRAQANEALERQHAQTEAAKNQQVAGLLKEMLEGVGPSKALGRDTTMLKEILDKAAERIAKELTNQPEVEIEICGILADTYEALGLYKEMSAMAQEDLRAARVQYSQPHSTIAAALQLYGKAQWHLGDYEQADKSTRAALAMYEKTKGDDSIEAAASLQQLADVLVHLGKLPEAESASRNSVALYAKVLGEDNPELATPLGTLAEVLCDQGKLDEAETICRRTVLMERKRSGDNHPALATCLQNLGTVLFTEGKIPEAETMFRESLAIRRKLLSSAHPDVANVLNSLANVLRRENKLPEAETMYRQAIDIQRKLMEQEHPYLAVGLGNLAGLLSEEGKNDEAESLVREALAMQRKLLGEEHPMLGGMFHELGSILYNEGKWLEAETAFRQAVTIYRKLLGDEHRDTANSIGFLGVVLWREGKLAESEALFREALKLRQKLLGPQDPDVAAVLNNLILVLQSENNLAEAEALARAQLQDMRSRMSPGAPQLAGPLSLLATSLLAQEKFAESESLSRECLAIREKVSPDAWSTFSTRTILGRSLVGQKRYAEAEPLLVSGIEGMTRHQTKVPLDGALRTEQALQNLVLLYQATGRTNEVSIWRNKLTDFEQTQTNKPSSPVVPAKSSL